MKAGANSTYTAYMKTAPIIVPCDQPQSKQRPIGSQQLRILTKLGSTWRLQKLLSRIEHKVFNRGWTYVHFDRTTRLKSLQGLIRRGLVQACCEAHDGTDAVRISDAGRALLVSMGVVHPTRWT